MRVRTVGATGAAVLMAVSGFGLMVPAAASPGNGNGTATGRPADGTVGKADGKAPRGQTLDDMNKGYECDANHGIGRGNPAHTGCEETPR